MANEQSVKAEGQRPERTAVVADSAPPAEGTTADGGATPAEGTTVVARGAPPAEARIGTFSSLGVRDYRFLLMGTTLSNAAQWIQQVTLGWLVYDLTASGTILGSMNLVRSVATVGLAPVSGVLIDRIDRRRLMLAVNAWLMGISLVLSMALLSGRIEVWYLFVFTFCGGIAQAIDMPLRQTAAFLLVPRAMVPNAVALIQTGWSLMRSLGPGIGGFLILWFGPGGNFLVQATAYALIMVTIWRIRFPATASASRRGGGLQFLKEGLRYVAKERTTRTFVMMGWILPLLIIPNFSALPPIYAKDVFAGGPQVLGFLMSAVGVGGIIGGLVTASLGKLERRGVVQLTALLLTSLSLIGFALSAELWQALAMLAFSGFFEMIFLTTNQTLLQLSIPDELRGRVTSVASLNMGLAPLGAFVAGVGADLVGPSTITIVLCTISSLVAVLVFLFSSTVREYRLSQAMKPGAGKPRD
jgi:MFS transporter, DHA1 family, staphyloferrin A biosynthesis exporter